MSYIFDPTYTQSTNPAGIAKSDQKSFARWPAAAIAHSGNRMHKPGLLGEVQPATQEDTIGALMLLALIGVGLWAVLQWDA